MKKMFTLVELIITIVIISILAAIVIPNISNFKKDATTAALNSDARNIETAVDMYVLKNYETYPTEDGQATPKRQEDNHILYELYLVDGEKVESPVLAKMVETKTLQKNGFLNKEPQYKEEQFFLVVGGDVVWSKDYKLISSNGTEEKPENPEDVVTTDPAKDEDFIWVKQSSGDVYSAKNEEGKGYYKYIGTAEIVKIPHEINGTTLTSYYKMFHLTGSSVKKVISDNLNITSMDYMFSGALMEDIDLSDFDTSSVTSMKNMFSGNGGALINGIVSTNKIKTIQGIEDWDLSSILNIDFMFDSSPVENVPQIYKKWADKGYLKNLTSYRGIFKTGGFKRKIDLNEIFANVDTSKVTDMSFMFANSQAIEIDLSNLNTSNVTDMSFMFSNSESRMLDLSNLNTSKVTNMRNMFSGAKATKLNLENLDTSNVIDMNAMFQTTEATELNLSSFNTSKVTRMGSMFTRSKAQKLDLSSFNTSKVTEMQGMFQSSAAKDLNLSSFDTSKVLWMDSMFGETEVPQLDLSNFNTSSVISMDYMFSNSKVQKLDLSSFDTSNVYSMQGMFKKAQATELNLSSFNTMNVTNLSEMFRETQVTVLDLSSFRPSFVMNMDDMFLYSKITTGYAKTQEYANLFNNSYGKPSQLNFSVK